MRIYERAASDGTATSSASETLSFSIKSTAAASTAVTGTTASSASSAATSPVTSASPLPQPFDTSIGSNFTNSNCPKFFESFLGNSSFQSCLPFSLLLENSNSFFTAEKSFVRTTQALDATCNVNFDQCNGLMQSLAREIKGKSACDSDYLNRNPLVIQAYDGLLAYQVLYQAGCLKDSSGSYCFANAVTNTSSVTDSYPYYIGVGMSLPVGSRPTCNGCLKNTMNLFAGAATNGTQPVSEVYNQAAQQINLGCGPDYTNSTVVTTSSAASARYSAGLGSSAALLLVLLSIFV